MRLAIYKLLYQLNFHPVEARPALPEQGLRLRIDDVEDFRGIRWAPYEACREANRRCFAQIEALEARERDGLYQRELNPEEVVEREFRSSECRSRESEEPGAAKAAENPRRSR